MLLIFINLYIYPWDFNRYLSLLINYYNTAKHVTLQSIFNVLKWVQFLSYEQVISFLFHDDQSKVSFFFAFSMLTKIQVLNLIINADVLQHLPTHLHVEHKLDQFIQQSFIKQEPGENTPLACLLISQLLTVDYFTVDEPSHIHIQNLLHLLQPKPLHHFLGLLSAPKFQLSVNCDNIFHASNI